MALQFGVNIWPHQWQDVSRIEELGYDSAWTSEHIFFYFPTFDALTSLAAMAALTSRIRLGTAVLLLPLRPAALAAKEIASVDIISGGRLILGAGIGGEYPKEFEAVGVPVRERGTRADEALRVLKLLYSEDNVRFEGRFTKLDGVSLMPKPAQPGGPPVWIAGRSEAAMRRAGRLADGYFPYLFSPERFRDGLAKAREYAEKAGRDPRSITGAIYQFLTATSPTSSPPSAFAMVSPRRANTLRRQAATRAPSRVPSISSSPSPTHMMKQRRLPPPISHVAITSRSRRSSTATSSWETQTTARAASRISPRRASSTSSSSPSFRHLRTSCRTWEHTRGTCYRSCDRPTIGLGIVGGN